MLDWFLDIYKCPSHRMGNQLLKSRWKPDWHGVVPRWIFRLLTIRIFGLLDRCCWFQATGNSIALKTALKMQRYFTWYYFSLHKRLLKMTTVFRQNRQKRVSHKMVFSRKNMLSLACEKKQVIFPRKKWIFVGYPLTCSFGQRYYNAGLIFGHL